METTINKTCTPNQIKDLFENSNKFTVWHYTCMNKLELCDNDLNARFKFEICIRHSEDMKDSIVYHKNNFYDLVKLNETPITEENIHLYYEFMSNEDKIKNFDTLSTLFHTRQNEIKELIAPNEDHFNKHRELETLRSQAVGNTIFGIKDTLKPIDEYITEIKESEGYKEYLKSTLAPKERLALEVNEWIDEVNETIGNEKSFHLKEEGLFTMQQVGSDRVQIRNPKENKEITFNISTTIDKALVRDIGRILEIKDLTLVGSNSSQEIKKSKIEKIHQKIQNNEVVPPSEYSKIDFESEAFNSLDDDVKETITNYVNERSDAINADALEKDKQQNTSTDLNV